MAKRKKKRKLKIKNILILLAIILMLVGVFYYILKMPINNIYITGNNILTDSIIMKEAKINKYPSFLLTSSREIKSNLEKNDYIKNVKVIKKLDNIIEIKITEYKAIALINQGSNILLSSGNIVSNTYELSDVPILNNSVADNIFSDFVKKFNKIDNKILRQISQLEYSPVNVDDKRFLLYMDDGNLVYITLTKIEKLNKYNDIKDKMDNKTGIIYLDSGNYIEIKDNKEKQASESNDNINN